MVVVVRMMMLMMLMVMVIMKIGTFKRQSNKGLENII
jgi:hypothetical protein